MYLFAKALHVIGFVSWFAGLFYLVRLFVYHKEANEKKTEEERKILKPQYELMERRLYSIITSPAMIITWIAGITMLYLNPAWLSQPWMHLKLTLLVILSGYTGFCKRMIRQLKENDGAVPYSSEQFRLLNEVPTLFLAAIALLAVFKNLLNFGCALAGLVTFGIALGIGVKYYKKYREKRGE